MAKPKAIKKTSKPKKNRSGRANENQINPEALVSKLKLDNQFKGGVGWFRTIGAFSIINSFIFLIFNGSLYFPVGLGATQLVDAVSYLAVQDAGLETAPIITGIVFVMDACIAGLFILFGSWAKKGNKIAYVIGIVLYLIDAVVVLMFGDFFGAGFHLLALIGLIAGYLALNKIEKWEATYGKSPLAVQLAAAEKAQEPPPVSGTRILKVVVPFTIGAAVIGLICYGLIQLMY